MTKGSVRLTEDREIPKHQARSKMSSMGSMFLRSKIEADHLTCSICFANFTRPKALPCIHTFCEDCLREYVVSRGYESIGRFPCPMCRNDVQMPAGGVQGFPDNHLVTSLSDTVDSSKQRPPLPPRPYFDNANNNYPTTTGGVDPAIQMPEYPPTQSNIYPQLPRLEDMPKPEMPRPKPIACSTGLIQRFGKYGPGLVDFHKPVGLAVGRNGEIVVSDHGGYRILIFNSGGELVRKFGCECIINDVSVTAENTILVSVKSKSSIMRKYTMEGRLLGEYGSHYRYEDAHGIAAMSTGHVVVSGLQNKCVYIFTEQYKFSDKFGRKGSGDEHFLTPYYVATNCKNNIVVTDRENHCVQVYNNAGKFKYRFGGKGSDHGQLQNPLGVCSDCENNIIVADSGNHRVEMFTSKGKHMECIVRDTLDIGPGVTPILVGVTSRNNIVVLLQGTQFVEVRIYMCTGTSMSQTRSCMN
ncbi:tripartite motif-containing protein 2-like [Haliotis cracherodii]|uniref:tripartite motif-containing protein 2-like n=1 Tax=Haliotis cracherodii TaxID=6455 RepID=UPI0039EB8ED2